MLKISWLLQVLVAVILVQTLFFKFTGAEESVHIFSTLGVEPWGRYLAGTMELIASVLLLVPGMAATGALLSLGVISGALVSHLTVLGIEIRDDGGLLFALAVIVATSSLAVLLIRWRELPLIASLAVR